MTPSDDDDESASSTGANGSSKASGGKAADAEDEGGGGVDAAVVAGASVGGVVAVALIYSLMYATVRKHKRGSATLGEFKQVAHVGLARDGSMYKANNPAHDGTTANWGSS